MASGEMPPNVLSLEAKKPVSVEPGGKMSYEYQAIFTNGAARQWIQGEALESNKFGRGLIRQLDKREVCAAIVLLRRGPVPLTAPLTGAGGAEAGRDREDAAEA